MIRLKNKNIENLTPFGTIDKDLHREISKKGGKAAQKKKREKKLMREQLEILMSLPLKDEDLRKELKEIGLDTNDIDNQMAVIVSLWNKAISGDVKAIEVIRDTLGEKPKDEVVQNISMNNPYKDLTTEELKKLANE